MRSTCELLPPCRVLAGEAGHRVDAGCVRPDGTGWVAGLTAVRSPSWRSSRHLVTASWTARPAPLTPPRHSPRRATAQPHPSPTAHPRPSPTAPSRHSPRRAPTPPRHSPQPRAPQPRAHAAAHPRRRAPRDRHLPSAPFARHPRCRAGPEHVWAGQTGMPAPSSARPTPRPDRLAAGDVPAFTASKATPATRREILGVGTRFSETGRLTFLSSNKERQRRRRTAREDLTGTASPEVHPTPTRRGTADPLHVAGPRGLRGALPPAGKYS